jgi:hypothetical protein
MSRGHRGWTTGFAALVGLIALVMAGPVEAGAQVANSPCNAPPPGTFEATFEHTSKHHTYQFKVPENVTTLVATVEGGHGGGYGPTGPGGPGGGVDATFAVTPGECLTVIVGEYGYHGGGDGWAHGGDHGTIGGGLNGNGASAAGGGGASAILRGSTPLVVAGGGGGGGGDSSPSHDQHGGAGGAGGNPPGDGGTGQQAIFTDGGKGGGEKGRNGGGGDSRNNNDSGDHGAGGGGGGGYHGGSGGHLTQYQTGGGGGGGGGSSALLAVPVNIVPWYPSWDYTTYFTSTRSCPYRKIVQTCNGEVTLRWPRTEVPLPDNLQLPQIRILPTDLQPNTPSHQLQPVTSLPVKLSPVAPASNSGPSANPVTVPVRLRLLHRYHGKYRIAARATVTATEIGGTEFDLPLNRRVRRILREAKHARFLLIATDLATGQRISRQKIDLYR